MTTQAQLIRTRVTEEIKADFIEMAENHGVTESELLRLIITNAINNQKSPPISKEKETNIEISELRIRLPKFLIAQVKDKAKIQGMATSRWIKSLVQSNLIKTPVLTDSAIMAIKASDRELAAIGNNLNQIARKINESEFNIELVKLDKLEEVKRAVNSVRSSIDELIRISRNGWSANND